MILVDCNNFYASCERLFNPKIEKKPVIVLSNNDGCVISRSEEAKQIGVPMGSPFFKIKDFCKTHKIHVYSSNFALYGDISQRIMSILADSAPEIEIYSIDEAFLKFPSSWTPEDLYAYSIELRRKIKHWTGIPTSFGIAPSKTLAKAASKLAKKVPSGVYNLMGPTDEVLANLTTGDIWGVGRRTVDALKRMHIYTAKELRDMDSIRLRKSFGVVGERMQLELKGISALQLEEASSSQTISCSRSFGRRVTSLEDLGEAMSTYAATACQKLREQNQCARSISIYVEAIIDQKLWIRKVYGASFNFPVATYSTAEVIHYAKECLKSVYKPGFAYKKCGLTLFDLTEEDGIEADLFSKGPDLKQKLISEALDAVNQKYGKNTLFYGAMGVKRDWRMKSENSSPHYTTEWEQLLTVR
jgi:DNA polymerase V